MERQEHTIDVAGKPMGRIATEIATLLRGKHKPSFQLHIDGGDTVRIQNVADMVLTGKKAEQVVYYSHSGYPGGIKSKTAKKRMEENPGELLRDCVRKMLPDTKLRKEQLKRLIIE